MPKPKKLVLASEEGPERIIFDVWRGRVRERKMVGKRVLDWSAFDKEEVKKIKCFIAKALKHM